MKRWISAAIFLLLALVQLCQAAPTTQPTVGYIVSPDKKPIAGAKIFATMNDWNEIRTIATATTDAKGFFHLSATTQPVRLTVQASGFALSPAQTYPSTEEAQNAPNELLPASILRVQLVDANGKPASGIKLVPRTLVSSRDLHWFMEIPQELQNTLTQTTDGNGICAFESLPADSTVRLRVLDDRFAQLDYLDPIHLPMTRFPKAV
jgi:hypothetical protein